LLVCFLQSLLASYDNLSRSSYSGKLMTAAAMSAGGPKTEDGDASLRMRIGALGRTGAGGTKQDLNKFKEEIRKTGRERAKKKTSPFG
jgi:hypothetical protein